MKVYCVKWTHHQKICLTNISTTVLLVLCASVSFFLSSCRQSGPMCNGWPVLEVLKRGKLSTEVKIKCHSRCAECVRVALWILQEKKKSHWVIHGRVQMQKMHSRTSSLKALSSPVCFSERSHSFVHVTYVFERFHATCVRLCVFAPNIPSLPRSNYIHNSNLNVQGPWWMCHPSVTCS